MEFDFKKLEERFKQVPKDIQIALTSPEIVADIKKIAARNSLLIDQESVLYDLTGYVMLGLLPADQFVDTFAKEAGVDRKIASKVAEDINIEILATIRSTAQAAQEIRRKDVESHSDDLAALEKVSGIAIDRDDIAVEDANPVKPSDRDRILGDLENPVPSAEKTVPKPAEHTEALVDRMLAAPVATSSQATTISPPANLPGIDEGPAEAAQPAPMARSAPQAAPAQPKESQAPAQPQKPKVDPYREAFN